MGAWSVALYFLLLAPLALCSTRLIPLCKLSPRGASIEQNLLFTTDKICCGDAICKKNSICM